MYNGTPAQYLHKGKKKRGGKKKLRQKEFGPVRDWCVSYISCRRADRVQGIICRLQRGIFVHTASKKLTPQFTQMVDPIIPPGASLDGATGYS